MIFMSWPAQLWAWFMEKREQKRLERDEEKRQNLRAGSEGTHGDWYE